MKNFSLIIVLLCCALVGNAQKYVTDSMMVNGNMRSYTIFLPEGIQPGAPLVVCMHGYGKKVAKPSRFDLDPVAAREKFAVCYIAGLRDTTGHYGYNVGYPAQAAMHKHETSDICTLTEAVQKRFNLSKTNTFATGMSNGGDMCYLMAYEGQTTFRALAPVAGITMAWIYKKYEAPHPVSIYEIHGTADKTSSWDGDMENKGGWGAYLPLNVSIGYWVARNRCTTIEPTDTIPGKDPSNGHYIVRHRYTGGTDGTEVWVDEVVNAPHSWHAKDMDTGEAVWAFFRHFLK